MKDRCRIFYVGDKSGADGKGVLTIATQINEDGKTCRLGFAFCSPKDRFSRKMGRIKAMARLGQNNTLIKDSFHSSLPNQWNFDKYTIDAAMKVFNSFLLKPNSWQHRKLLNIPQTGLTFVDRK